MKKKLVLIVAILVIIVSASAILIGCVPNNPVDFIEQWFAADVKSYTAEGFEDTIISGNIAYVSGIDENGNEHYRYTEITQENVIISYFGYKEAGTGKVEWTRMSTNNDEFNLDINEVIMGTVMREKDVKEFIVNATLKNGVYVPNEGYSTTIDSISLKGDNLTIIVEGELKLIFKIGGSKITIPQEAKDAEEMEY